MSARKATKSAGASAAAPGEAAEPIVDVWSRTARKYRVRAVVLLVLDVILFAGLGCFAYWLRSGEPFAPRTDDYAHVLARTFHPSADTRVALSTLLQYPIDQRDVPMQIPIHGLLLAALVSVPILISILYRFAACLPFLLIVAFLAMMPWLALTLLASCILASVRPFRFNFRYASAMTGLVPIIIYIFSASRQSQTAIERLSAPIDQVRYMAPWSLAIVAALLLMAASLVIAKTVNYRPGAVAPLLALLLLTPALMFEFAVGRDELYYRLLELRYGPTSPFFAESELAQEFAADAREAGWDRDAAGLRERAAGERGAWWSSKADEWFARRQAVAVAACDTFMLNFPDSRYHVNALYIKALTLDARLDHVAFTSEGVLRAHDEFPSATAREPWTSIVVNRPESPMASVAALRLAELDARDCSVADTVADLQELVRRFGAGTQGAAAPEVDPPAQGRFENLLRRRPPEAKLKIQVDNIVQSAHKLRDLLARNTPDPKYGNAPLCGAPGGGEPGAGLLLCNPRHPQYVDNLEWLLRHYPDMLLTDNVRLIMAERATAVPERIALLEAIEPSAPEGDAVPEALYRLGLAYQDAGRLDDARRTLQRLREAFADSIWKQPADARLRVLPTGPVSLKSE